MIASHRCCRFVGCTSMMQISRSTTSQMYSIGLSSGYCGGHLSTVYLKIYYFAEGEAAVPVENILKFATGLTSFPQSGLEPLPQIKFLDDSPFPMANTCSNWLKLPLQCF
ncbi:hypothetical protein ATANTOWER_015817 [Ataeniobius toweri]|uniref:HECT domain-containing protein n=1 Tax=Ataeniobius toweri TaxID=208326 RepID=A0ABU7BIV7_9TELE|nr:hypothetical protein [Ataeniobius toweri]